MTAQGERKAWVSGVIERRCRGNAAAFGRAIGKDSSYVSRMLATNTKQQRGVSDEMVEAILRAFPGESPPLGWYEVDPAIVRSTGKSYAELLQLRNMILSAVMALVSSAGSSRTLPRDIPEGVDRAWLLQQAGIALCSLA